MAYTLSQQQADLEDRLANARDIQNTELSFDNLKAEINSGHFYTVYGYIGDIFVYAAKAPYSEIWHCTAECTEKFWWLRGQANAEDFVQAIIAAVEQYKTFTEMFTKPKTDNEIDQVLCPFCQSPNHTADQHKGVDYDGSY